MQTMPTTVTQKGQVTIPVQIRRMLKLKQGDKIAFLVTKNKQVRVKTVSQSSIMDLFGSAKSKVRIPQFANAQDLIDWESEQAHQAMAEEANK